MAVKKRASIKRATKRTKPGVQARIKPGPKVLKRLKEIQVSPVVFDKIALQLLAELEERHGGLSLATAKAWDAAVTALKAEVHASEDTGSWLSAARRAVGLS